VGAKVTGTLLVRGPTAQPYDGPVEVTVVGDEVTIQTSRGSRGDLTVNGDEMKGEFFGQVAWTVTLRRQH
jgi:hypothetical protein